MKNSFLYRLLKCIVLSAVLLAGTLSLNAQDNRASGREKKYEILDSTLYLKGKKQHKAGVVLLSVGGGVMAAGLLTSAIGWSSSNGENAFYGGIVLFLGGAACMIASIPILIVSHSKIDKSRVKIAIKNTPIQPLPHMAVNMPAVGFSILL